MKVVLAAINAKYIHSNLAVYSLKAYAKEFKEQIGIAEYTINQQTDDILMDIYKRSPGILCFSCYIWNLNYVEELIREVHKILPETIIWVGGPEVSYDSVDVLQRLPEVTGVMKGEGEKTFAEMLKAYDSCGKLSGGRSGAVDNLLRGVDGITFRTAEKEIVENEWRGVMDLSEVPFVYDHMEDFQNKIIYYESSRGCPFRCSYCLSSVDKCLRFRDIELVKKELQFFLDNNVPQVKFVDRTFNCKHEHAMAVWNYIKEHDNGITNFHFEISSDLLNEEEIALIRTLRPGLIQLEIGVQSTNPETIREIRRTMKFGEVARIVKLLNENKNVHQHLDLIAGLPYEDYESFGNSFNDVYALAPEQLQLGFLKVLKGSYMEEKKTDYELIYKSRPPYEVLSTKWLPYSDVLRLKGIEEMVEVYYNSGQFQYTLRAMEELFSSPFAMFETLAGFYERHALRAMNHARITRYEILLDFIREYHPEKTDIFKELLTLDLYLRENAKNRPDFAGEYMVEKEWLQEFYEKEAADHTYLKGYGSFDKRQMRKMTHVERFERTAETVWKSEAPVYVLFDYQNRNPLDHQASYFVL